MTEPQSETISNFRSGFVAILGRPNVGKSTLLNQLVGERIGAVSPKAQTTRRRLRGILSEVKPDISYQMIFVDMPGLHVPPEKKLLNKFCVDEAVGALDGADLYIYLIDASREFKIEDPNSDESFVASVLRKAQRKSKMPLVVLLNKSDLVGGKDANIFQKIKEQLQFLQPDVVLPFSATKAEDCSTLLDHLRARLPIHPPYYPTDIVSDENVRTLVSEHIHEQLFWCLGEEIPYSCAIEIIAFQEPKSNRKKTEIHAAIHVERASQKQIVIGKAGAKIKEIGTRARMSIEKFLNQQVVLRLHVKVSPDWTKDRNRLQYLGYSQKQVKQ